jgi:uncharacterized protein (TIGR00375 family)
MISMREFSKWMAERMKNITLSSQRMYVNGIELQKKVRELNGLFIPAHIFTPYKSLYGRGVTSSLSEVLDPAYIDAVELGLSSNTAMADQIEELHSFSFVTNSDAHSLPKIGREHQKVKMAEPSFEELRKALHRIQGRKIVANYGLDPLLGKYHRTTCDNCLVVLENTLELCPLCSGSKIVKGVYDRLLELKSYSGIHKKRPPYIHQVPLEFIPGLGPKTLEKLRDYFKTEMAILHEAPEEALRTVLSSQIAESIIKARNGTLTFQSGGGGKYGKVNG